MENCSFTILLSSHKNLSHILAHMEDGGTHIGNLCTKPKALQQRRMGLRAFTQRTVFLYILSQWSATCVCVSACVRFAFTCVR